MATALLLWSDSSSSKENGDEDHQQKPSSETQEPKQEIIKPRSKRSAKSHAPVPKKQPQRGLGVAQLERLRLQEKYSKFTETDRSLAPVQAPIPAQNLHFPFAFPTVEPDTGMSSLARFAPPSYYEAFNEAQISSQQCIFQQRCRIANGGFPAGTRGLFPDPVQLDQFRIAAAHDARFQNRTGFPYTGLTSTDPMMMIMASELSSSQKTQCLSEQYEACVKKKRYHGENLGFQEFSSSGGGFREVGMNGGDFLGLNIGSGRAVEGGSRGFGGRGEWRGCSSGMHVDEEMQDVAMQRNGKSVGECDYREYYEFFPRKDCCSSRGSGSAAEATVGEASSSPSSSFLDLSLKLSS